jgi:hypothetical protein
MGVIKVGDLGRESKGIRGTLLLVLKNARNDGKSREAKEHSESGHIICQWSRAEYFPSMGPVYITHQLEPPCSKGLCD